jgi:hypothetical protein
MLEVMPRMKSRFPIIGKVWVDGESWGMAPRISEDFVEVEMLS